MKTRDAILGALSGGPQTAYRLAMMIGVSRNGTKAACWRLVRNGEVEVSMKVKRTKCGNRREFVYRLKGESGLVGGVSVGVSVGSVGGVGRVG